MGTIPVKLGGVGLKKTTAFSMMCLCKTVQQSRWTRQSNFARIGRAPQEAKSERALFGFIRTNQHVIAVAGVKRTCSARQQPWW